jgi:hypothetical protein
MELDGLDMRPEPSKRHAQLKGMRMAAESPAQTSSHGA